MKELHNHIFSNTTCISKETMLKYINHQLSEKELHDVEKHMLDCEFCSDAIEGLRYAENSSVLFAIDNKIDQRIRTGGVKTHVMRYLMVAASILIIVFGAYFTFDYFNDTVSQEAGLAVNNEDDNKDKTKKIGIVEKSGEVIKNSANENEQEELSNSVATTVEILEEDFEEPADMAFGAAMEQAPPALEIAEVVEDEEEVETITVDAMIVTESYKESENVSSTDSGKLNKEQKEKNETRANNERTITTDGNLGYAAEMDDSKDFDAVKVEAKKQDRKRKESTSKGSKKRYKTAANAPSYSAQESFADKLEEETELVDNRNQQGTITLSNHKVVDYFDEYQKQYDLKQVVETKSTSADFESQEEAAEAEREVDETTVEITYRATIEKAMAYYNAKKYTLALEQFNVILKEHPDEVNGLFYGGLSNYHLQRYDKAEGELDKVLVNPKTSFNEEAEWYKALTLIKLKKTTEAKQLFQKIIDGGGFYKAKAQQQLKNM